MMWWISGSSQKNLLPDTIGLCFGDSASIEIRHHFAGNASIKWITPSGVINSTKKIRASRQGKYYIRITSSEFPAPLVDSSYVRMFAKPFLRMQDTTFCRSKPVFLDARNPGMKYLWSNGQTAQKIKVESAGRYWVKITNGKCSFTDTVMVKMLPGSGVSLNNEMIYCLNDENKIISVRPNPGTKILWSTGATSPVINVNKEGVYWVRTESSSCGIETDTVRVKMKACECEMMIPNSFTPNEDNRNDLFFPVLSCEYTYYTISITDRWGNTVFSSNNPASKWDGRYKGNLCPEDIYIYRIESTERGTDKKLVRNGHISLFR